MLSGTFDELVQQGGHFAQLVKQLQSEAEKEEEEEKREEKEAEEALEGGGAEDVEDEEIGLQAARVNFEAAALGGSLSEEPRSRAASESEMRRQSSARQKPQKQDTSKAKLMTSEDAATGMSVCDCYCKKYQSFSSR